jgi:hypothetical protein
MSREGECAVVCENIDRVALLMSVNLELLYNSTVPIVFDEAKYVIMVPTLYPDGDTTKSFDGGSKTQAYHLLSLLDRPAWNAPSDNFDLNIVVLPRDMENRPGVEGKKSAEAAGSDIKCIKVKVFFGGVLYNGKYFSDFLVHKSGNRKTVILGEDSVPCPITRDKLVSLADHLMRSGALSCTFSEEDHLIRREQPRTQPCGPATKKGMPEPEAPEAVEIPATFLIDEAFTGKDIHIIVFDKSMKEVAASSVWGGSHVPDDTGIEVGKSRLQNRIMVGMRTHKALDMVKGLVMPGGIKDQSLYSDATKQLIDWGLARIDKSDMTAHNVESRIATLLATTARDQAMLDSMPKCIRFATDALTRSAGPSSSSSSSSSNTLQDVVGAAAPGGNDDDDKYVCRIQGDASGRQASLTKTQLQMALNKTIAVEIRLAKQAGKQRKAGTWFLLHEVCLDAIGGDESMTDTFVVTPVGEGKQTRLRMAPFKAVVEVVPLEEDEELVALEEDESING